VSDLSLRECEQLEASSGAAPATGTAAEATPEEVTGHVKAALALAEAALGKLASVPCQELMEMVVQLQLRLGLPATTLPSTLPEQRSIAKACSSASLLCMSLKSALAGQGLQKASRSCTLECCC
jgi:hypothetical protein